MSTSLVIIQYIFYTDIDEADAQSRKEYIYFLTVLDYYWVKSTWSWKAHKHE